MGYLRGLDRLLLTVIIGNSDGGEGKRPRIPGNAPPWYPPAMAEIAESLAKTTEATLREAAPEAFAAHEAVREAEVAAETALRAAAPEEWETYEKARIDWLAASDRER